MLASRLQAILPQIISDEQTSFVKGRQIIDGILIANEVLQFVKDKKIKSMFLKVDFEKAFDTVSLGYLISVMVSNGIWRDLV